MTQPFVGSHGSAKGRVACAASRGELCALAGWLPHSAKPHTCSTWPPQALSSMQYGGTKGKRHRLREAMLWVDPPEYYSGGAGELGARGALRAFCPLNITSQPAAHLCPWPARKPVCFRTCPAADGRFLSVDLKYPATPKGYQRQNEVGACLQLLPARCTATLQQLDSPAWPPRPSPSGITVQHCCGELCLFVAVEDAYAARPPPDNDGGHPLQD